MGEAAAEDAGQRAIDVVVGRGRRAVDERLGAQDDAAQAETALRGLFVDERLLDRMQPVERAEPVERRDLGVLRRFDRRDARSGGLAADDDRAGAALAEAAAELR